MLCSVFFSLFLLLLSCTGGKHIVCHAADTAIASINIVRTELSQTSEASSASVLLQQSYERWTQELLLNAIIDHDTLDRIETLYLRSIELISHGTPQFALSELAELSQALCALRENEYLTLANIL